MGARVRSLPRSVRSRLEVECRVVRWSNFLFPGRDAGLRGAVHKSFYESNLKKMQASA